jgi:tetratricopeptide (TPR) repeat protein
MLAIIPVSAVLCLLLAQTLPAALAAPSGDPTASQTAQAYYQFMLGGHFESEGELDRAMAAYREAARLDPESAEIRAELAGFFARQGRVDDASREARAALALDPANHEANRILGSILASLTDPGTAGNANDRGSGEAALHLERGRRGDGTDVDPALDLVLARLYIRSRQHDKAIALLRDLLERELIPEAYLLLAEAWKAAGNGAEAARALEAGAEASPRLLLSLAEMYEGQQRWSDAAAAYERAAALTPQSAEVKTRWAGALLNTQDDDAATARARQMLEQLATSEPPDDRTLYLLSQAQRRSRDLAAAEATARRVIALDPNGLWGAWALAQVLEDRRDYTGVVTTLSAALSDNSTRERPPSRQTSVMLTHLAFAQLQLGQHEDAASTFTKAKEVSGGDDTFDLYLAQAYVSARRFDQALNVLRPLRATNPQDARLAQLEARALAGSGRRDDAIATLRVLTDGEADQPSVYLSLADILAEDGRATEAHAVLDRAAVRFPDAASVPFQRGALYERARDYPRAEEAFRAVIAREPAHAPALNYLGYMLAERGERLDEAVALVQRALAIDPGNGSYLDSLGWAYFKLQRYEDARTHLAEAASQLPTNSVVQDHLGDALAALGRHADAIGAWQRALAGDREAVDQAVIASKIARAKDLASR